MSPDLKKCEAQALKLPPKERAVLAEHLIASLDSLDDAENERLWLEEADRRYQEFKKGNVSARPAEDVLRDARSAIE
jgi:putative addiction module component (TIGR02574 family)